MSEVAAAGGSAPAEVVQVCRAAHYHGYSWSVGATRNKPAAARTSRPESPASNESFVLGMKK